MLEHYFLEEDWTIFESTDLAAAPKLRTMSKRLALLGITCPGEKVLKRSIAIIECVDPDVANKDQQVKRQMMHDLRAHLKAEDTRDSFPFAHIAVYPDDPKDLPDEVLQHAYGDQRPVRRNKQLADLDARFAASGYRSTHKTLRRTGSELARTASARELPKAELSGGIDAQALLNGLGQVMQMIMGGKGPGPAEPTIQLLGAGAASGASPGSSGGAGALTPPPKAVSAPGETPALPDASKLALKPPCLSKPRNPEPEDPLAACEERLREITNKAASAGRTDSGRAKKARKATAAAAALAGDDGEGDDEEDGPREHAAAAKPTKGTGKTGAGVMKRPAAATPTTGKGKPGAGKKSAREKACQKAYDKAVKALGKDAPKEARAWAGKNAYRKRGEQFDRDGC